MTYITIVPPIYFNALQYGATGNGTTDDTSAIQAAIAAAAAAGGGIVFFPSGTYKVSVPLTLTSANVLLLGAGGQSATIQPSASFSGAQVITISADFCSVRDLTIAYANTTYSGNPAADGIKIAGAKSVTLQNVNLNYLNGWGVNSVATAGSANYWAQLVDVHTFQCAKGCHVQGVSGSSYNAAHTLTNCIFDQTQNGDAFLLEDAHDVLVTNLEGSVTAGSGNGIHLKGQVYGAYFTNMDVGPYPGPSTGATLLIESGTNGSPRQVGFANGILEGGSTGVSITAGTQITFSGIDIYNNGTHGFSATGGDDIELSGCKFYLNGSSGGAGHYDFQNTGSGAIHVQGCKFLTPQGTGAQQTASAVNDTAGTTAFEGNLFTTATPFNTFPAIVRHNKGYNPVGNVSVSVPASNTTFATNSNDLTYYVSGGTVTAIKVGGTSTGLTSGSFKVVAQQIFSITYSVAPSVTAFGD